MLVQLPRLSRQLGSEPQRQRFLNPLGEGLVISLASTDLDLARETCKPGFQGIQAAEKDHPMLALCIALGPHCPLHKKRSAREPSDLELNVYGRKDHSPVSRLNIARSLPSALIRSISSQPAPVAARAASSPDLPRLWSFSMAPCRPEPRRGSPPEERDDVA